MAHDATGMVAVASGTLTQVRLWCNLLHTAAIDVVYTESLGRIDPAYPDNQDVWVLSNDADRARYIISDSGGSTAVLWS